jgi:hypothetical protein
MTHAGKGRRNNDPQEISNLTVKPGAVGCDSFLVTKSVAYGDYDFARNLEDDAEEVNCSAGTP